jgi:predicted ATPase/DNA-binding XRE family transcriptional regulator
MREHDKPERAPSFGERPRCHRIEAGLTQEELAERSGLSVRGLSDLERDVHRAPYPETVHRLAAALRLADQKRKRSWLTGESCDSAAPRTTFPMPISSFVGRERELDEVQGLLETTRLLTLVGVGGVGKTRLALQVADRLRHERADGVAAIDLGVLTDPRLVSQSVGAALGILEQPGRSFLAVLTDALRSRDLLLLLDNCEHLVDACAALADRLLSRCARLTILATSREGLGIGGETLWRVPSLSLPDVQTALTRQYTAQSDAVQLFVQRACAALPGFELTGGNAPAIVSLCRRVDGIPLALELAAAWVPVLSVEQIADRLDDRFRLLARGSLAAPARQQTLQATLDWSYALLDDAERHLFDELSVFAGGWSLEAIEAVSVHHSSNAADVVELLARLVDKSLVLADRPEEGLVRYRLLETPPPVRTAPPARERARWNHGQPSRLVLHRVRRE